MHFKLVALSGRIVGHVPAGDRVEHTIWNEQGKKSYLVLQQPNLTLVDLVGHICTVELQFRKLNVGEG